MREFARLAGISNPYLSQIERGLRAPSEQVVNAIAETLKVSSETLYEEAGVPVDEPEPSKVVAAIREDPGLTGRQRQALIQVYPRLSSQWAPGPGAQLQDRDGHGRRGRLVPVTEYGST